MNKTVTVSIGPELNAALQALKDEGAKWGPRVTVDQNMVDAFTALTGDENPIHKVGAESGAIVPGLLTLALLPKLTPLAKRSDIGGFTVINRGVVCEFSRKVPVEGTIRMGFCPETPTVDRLGVHLPTSFWIGLEPLMKIVAKGRIELLLVK